MNLTIRHLERRVRIPEFMAPRVFAAWFFNTQKQLQLLITIHLNVLLICWFCLILLTVIVYLIVLIQFGVFRP